MKEVEILLSVRKRARRLDKGIGCCCCRLGYGFFIGLIPVYVGSLPGPLLMANIFSVGDFADAILAWNFVVRKAAQCKLSKTTLSRMHANILVMAGMGAFPFLGDIADQVFKCNMRNATILEEALIQRYRDPEKGGRKSGKNSRAVSRNRAQADRYYDHQSDAVATSRAHANHSRDARDTATGPTKLQTDDHREARDTAAVRAMPQTNADHGLGPAPILPPRDFDERYGNVHERLKSNDSSGRAAKPQPAKKGGSWWSRNIVQKGIEQDETKGMAAEEAVPSRPPRPDALRNRDGFI